MNKFIERMDRIRNWLKPIYLFMYRGSAFFVISGALIFLLLWGVVILFFLINTSWIVPTHLSPTSDKMLQFTSGYQQALQNYETIEVQVGQSEREWKIAQTNLNNIERLRASFNDYSTRAAQIGNDKLKDIHTSTLLKGSLDVTIVSTIDSQRAGLLTQADAAQTLAAIQQFENSVTDSKMALNNEIITTNTNATQLAAQYLQAASDVQTKHDVYAAAQDSLKISKEALDSLNQSSYKRALDNHGMDLMFISYNNSRAKEGAPIFDCYLVFIACYRVGTIVHVYQDEQLVDFPMFNVKLSRTERGILAEANMLYPDSMHSTVLFVGRKPLFL